jgi:hypothetical protein
MIRIGRNLPQFKDIPYMALFTIINIASMV